MAGIKLAIVALENSGKTTLVSKIKDALIVSTDNKAFKGKVPHFRYSEYNGIEDFTNTVMSKLEAYNEKFGNYPKTLVIDSVTHLQANMEKWANEKFTGFNIWSNLGKEILLVNEFLESLAEEGINIVFTAHVQFDPDTARYKIQSPGQFGKNGSTTSRAA